MVICRTAAVVVLLILGAVILFQGTRAGVGIYPDSVMYIQGARSLLHQHGFTLPNSDGTYSPITLFPPLYSVVLAMASARAHDVVDVLRGVQIVLYLLSLASLMGIIAFATGNSFLAVLIGGLLGVFATDFISYQAIALSEGLFIACTLISCLLMQKYLATSRRLLLAGAALATSAAWLSRYAGVAWVPAGVLSLWLLSKQTRQRKIVDSLFFAGVASAGNLYWIYRNARTGESAFGRTFHVNHFLGQANRLFDDHLSFMVMASNDSAPEVHFYFRPVGHWFYRHHRAISYGQRERNRPSIITRDLDHTTLCRCVCLINPIQRYVFSGRHAFGQHATLYSLTSVPVGFRRAAVV